MGRPLEQYFHGDITLAKILGKKGIDGMNMFRKNLYLAEDRILCFELAMKAGSNWTTKLIKGAKADTDVPNNIIDFMSQRRRWLNGGLSSTLYCFTHTLRIFETGHNPLRKILLLIQALYSFVAFILSWFNLSAFLLTTFVVTNLTGSPPTGSKLEPWPFGNATPVFNAILQIFYISTIIWQLLLALGNRPKGERRSYMISFLIFGFIQLYFIMNVIYLVKVIIQDKTSASNASSYSYITTFYTEIGQLTVWITCASVFGVYYAAAFLNFDPRHMFIAYPQYLFVASVYTNIVNIYAFCNYNDLSWGTKTPSSASGALSSARIVKLDDTHQVIEAPDFPQADIDTNFEMTVKRALAPYVRPKPDTERTLKESYNAFRTKLIAAYIFSNFLLCIIVMNDSFDKLKFLVFLSNLSLSFE